MATSVKSRPAAFRSWSANHGSFCARNKVFFFLIANFWSKMDLKLNKVLILDSVDSVCAEKLTNAGIKVTTRGKLTENELIEHIEGHEAVVVRSATKVTEKVLRSATNLKAVGRAGTGVDNIDVDAAMRRGVLVMNAPGGNTISAVEQTCTLICALSRSIPQACKSMKSGRWDRKSFMGNELFGKCLAIIGLGRIGKEVCARMKSFGMTIIGFDPVIDRATAESWGVELLSLQEIWPRADYITVHTPLIPQTKYLLNDKVFDSCKQGVKIVNVARGGIIEEKALLKALQSGKCSGAALDVFEEEPPKNTDLIQHEKVICTPHLGANTVEAQKRVAIEIADQLIAMHEGKQLSGLVNNTALKEAGTSTARAWVDLASALGVVAGKLVKPEQGCRMNVELYGEKVNSLKDLMKAAVLCGFLKCESPEVNLVNSAVIAKDLGLEAQLKVHPYSLDNGISLTNSLVLSVQNCSSSYTLIGSCSSVGGLLFSINDCYFTSGLSLEKNLLFFNSSNLQAFGLVAKALQNTSLLALLSSASDKETWVVARTGRGVADIPSIQQVQLVAQIQFS